MKKKTRVVIVIEVFNREITSAILLKLELENRGYYVSIKRKSEDIGLRKADILIIPNGYKSTGYYDYRYRFNCQSGKIINLQWEQLFTRYEEENNKWLAEGKAKELVFLCWGQNRVDKLLNVGVDEHKVFKVGPIHTDTMRYELDNIWEDRQAIANKYQLDNSKKWIIFISSLTFAPSFSPFISSAKKLIDYVDYDQRHLVEERTQVEIIDWLEKTLEEYEDVLVIYRPHPTEKASHNLMEAEIKYLNRFYLISDLDLKQWITVADTLVLWNSTSAIECSLTKKRCIVARPYDIEYKDEYILYDGCDYASNYREFKEHITNTKFAFPIKKEKLDYYYDIESEPSYKRVCDVVDKVFFDNKYLNYERFYICKRFMYLLKRGILGKVVIKNFYSLLFEKFGVSIKSKQIRNRFFVDSWEKSIKEREEAAIIEKKIRKNLRSKGN